MAQKKSKTRRAKKDGSSTKSVVGSYWHESGRPLVSLAFVAPMIAAYEGGLLVLGPQAMRNGADVWLRQLLDHLGFSQYFLLPLLTCALLLGWHHLNKERWSVRWRTLVGMLFECSALAGLLLLGAQAQQQLLSHSAIGSDSGVATLPTLAVTKNVAQITAFFGAGIYEELLFRVMLFPSLAALLRYLGTPPRSSWIAAILLSSLLFAAAHYRLDLMIGSFHLVTSFGDSFEWRSFLFRFAAGVFFASLLLVRGFGITVGTHSLYDILVVFPM